MLGGDAPRGLAGTRRGCEAEPGQGALLGGLAFPQAEGPAAEHPLPHRAPRHSSGPPRSRAISSSGQNQHPVCSLTEGSAVWRIFPCFI